MAPKFSTIIRRGLVISFLVFAFFVVIFKFKSSDSSSVAFHQAASTMNSVPNEVNSSLRGSKTKSTTGTVILKTVEPSNKPNADLVNASSDLNEKKIGNSKVISKTDSNNNISVSIPKSDEVIADTNKTIQVIESTEIENLKKDDEKEPSNELNEPDNSSSSEASNSDNTESSESVSKGQIKSQEEISDSTIS